MRSKLIIAVLMCAAMLYGGSAQVVHGETVTIEGRAYAYPRYGDSPQASGDYASGRHSIHVQWRKYTPVQSGRCTVCRPSWSEVTKVSPTSDGRYAVTIPSLVTYCEVPDQRDCPGSSGRLYVKAWSVGPESPMVSTWYGSPNRVNSRVTMPDIVQAPHETGSKFWARRLGDGQYPIFLIEGFDPLDKVKSDDAKAFLQAAKLNNRSDLYSYLTTHDFVIWLIQLGLNGGDSIAGRTCDNPRACPDSPIVEEHGLAYDAMRLIKQIRDKHHPNRDIVVGGYSMGGTIAFAGLRKWCAGQWAAKGLPANCPEVALWFAADAPLNGANIPVSLQYYLKDDKIVEKISADKAELARALLDSWAAQELLKQRVRVAPGYSGCDTSCADTFGCSSKESDFTSHCSVDDADDPWSVHKKFMDWIGPLTDHVVTQTGVRKPGVALSVGKAPCPDPNDCGPNSANRKLEYLKIDVDTWGDHHLYTNSAGGKHEYAPGSLLSALAIINADPENPFPVHWEALCGLVDPSLNPLPCLPVLEDIVGGGVQSVQVKLYPTFISSRSALLWGNSLGKWKNHWYEDQNNYHSPPSCDEDAPCASGAQCLNGTCAERSMPVNSAGFLTAWIWEYLRGKKSIPVCDPVRTPIGRATMACRTPVCGDNFCDVGEVCFHDCVGGGRVSSQTWDQKAIDTNGASSGGDVSSQTWDNKAMPIAR
jgi:hypothetical protein